MSKLSVVIPSRTDQYLQATIDDLLNKAGGEIEVIVVCDGYWPSPVLRHDPRVIVAHHGTIHSNLGMREGINRGMRLATGEYVMKIDEHCMVEKGFDEKLKADCEDNWVVIPRRYRLDPDSWTLIEDGRPPIDYMYLAYPYERPQDKTCGLHGDEWKQRYHERKDILIDDTMSWQGSCYFMKKAYWDELFDPLDTENYGQFTQEAQEIGNKVWLSGGRLVVNKNTWYAHFHKGKRGKGYGFSNAQYKEHLRGTEKGRLYCIKYWMNTTEYEHDFAWLIEKFWPVPTWPENWREQIVIDAPQDFSSTYGKEYEPTW